MELLIIKNKEMKFTNKNKIYYYEQNRKARSY